MGKTEILIDTGIVNPLKIYMLEAVFYIDFMKEAPYTRVQEGGRHSASATDT